MRRYIQKLFGTTRRPTIRGQAMGTRLRITALEDRLTPADLMVTSLSVSAVPVASPGETIPLRFAVANVGTAAPGNWMDRVVLSADAVVTADDAQLALIPRGGGLPAGGAYSEFLTGVVPSGTPAGLRRVIVATDAANQVAETNEANNTRSVPIAVLAPASAGPVRTLAGRLQTAFDGPLVPTSVAAVGSGTAVAFTTANADYQIGGFRLTNIQATITVTAAGAASVAGTANLHVPTGGSSSLVIPVSFTTNGDTLQVSGSATFATIRFGTGPAVVAQNASISVTALANLTAGTSKASARLTAASATVENAAGQAVATVSAIDANVNSAGRFSATVSSVTGQLGPVAAAATGAQVTFDPEGVEPLVSVATATLTLPLNGATANLTATGFRIGQNGRYQFDALAGLALPGQAAGGVQATGSFAGEVRVSGTNAIVTLTGTANAFGTAVQVRGELTAAVNGVLGAGGRGLFGTLALETTGGATLLTLGQSLGFTYQGAARFLVNATNRTLDLTAAGETRTLVANTGRLVADGSLTTRGFTLAGVFDARTLPGNPTTVELTAAAELNLNRFGRLATDGSGSFRVTDNGVVGRFGLNRVSTPAGGVTLGGALALEVNTTGAPLDGIAAGGAVTVAGGFDLGGGFAVGGSARVGFRDNAGTSNDFFFASVNGSMSLFGGVIYGTAVGEIRSNGDVSLSMITGLSLAESQTAGTGLSLSGSVSVFLDRTGGGPLSFFANFVGSVRHHGINVVGAVAAIDATGRVHVTGVVGFVSWTWDFHL